MSKVIFGQSYNLIGDPEHRAFVKDIERNNVRISVLYNDLNVQSWRIENWLFPDAMKGRKAFLKYIGQFLHGAQQGKVDNERDLFFLLQNAEDPETGKRLSATELRAEAATLIAAGKHSIWIPWSKRPRLTQNRYGHDVNCDRVRFLLSHALSTGER